LHSDWGTRLTPTALTTQYIQGAATSIGAGIFTTAQMDASLLAFYAPTATLGGLAPWQLVSDPNISYVDSDGHTFHIGLAGFLDATNLLKAFFGRAWPRLFRRVRRSARWSRSVLVAIQPPIFIVFRRPLPGLRLLMVLTPETTMCKFPSQRRWRCSVSVYSACALAVVGAPENG
jgi:hypothetical protein